MTTVAVRGDIMAANIGNYIYGFRCHDSNIEKVNGELIGVSGNTVDIAKLVPWYIKGEYDAPPEYIFFKGDADPEATLLILNKAGEIKIVSPHGLVTVLDVSFFAIGSGAMAAMGAMRMGADAKKAVEISIMVDPGTVGPVEIYSCA